jgi:predicted aspartyl protease
MDMAAIGRRHALALLGAGAVVPSLARTSAACAAAAPETVETIPEAVFSPDDASVVVSTMEDARRRLSAPVMIDGHGPFDFMVDTGTNRSVISSELANQLQLPAGRSAKIHGIVGASIVPTVRLQSFGVGGRVASNLTMPAIDAERMDAAGILGVDGLKNQRLLFNLQTGRLQIVKSGSPSHASGGAVIRARRRFGQLTVVDTDLAGERITIMVDTGAEASVGNSVLRRLVQARPRASEFQQVVIAGVTGDRTIAQYGLMPEFRLGDLVIRNLLVAFADLHPFQLFELSERPAMLMGMDILRFFEEVELDFGRSEVRFQLPKTPFVDPAGDRRRT